MGHRLRTVLVAMTTAGLVAGWVLLSYDSPRGRPPDVIEGVGTFKFSAHQPGQPDRPVAYDPCRSIEVVVNESDAPTGGAELLRSAFEEVADATGLEFELNGNTQERVVVDLATGLGTGLGGPPFAPVLVDWTTTENVPGLKGDVAGLAGSTAVGTRAGGRRYVTGTVALDAPDLTLVLERENGEQEVRAIIMHELGHLVGLDHVDDAAELMYDDNVGKPEFGPGDRAGLAKLGEGRCFPGL